MAVKNWIPGSFDPGVAHVLNRGAHVPRLVEHAEEPSPVLRNDDDLFVRPAQSGGDWGRTRKMNFLLSPRAILQGERILAGERSFPWVAVRNSQMS